MNWPKPKGNSPTMPAADYAKQTRRTSAGGLRRMEEEAQRLVVARCDRLANKYPALAMVMHPANESYGGPRVKGVPLSVLKNSALGVRKGAPDLLCFHYRSGTREHGYTDERSGLALELKIAPNVCSPAQEQWHAYLIDNGWRVELLTAADARSLADLAWVCLAQYLGIEERDYLAAMVD